MLNQYDILHIIVQYLPIKCMTDMSLVCDNYMCICDEILIFKTDKILNTHLNILVKTEQSYKQELPDNVFFHMTKNIYVANIVILNLSRNGLTDFPNIIFNMLSLKILNLNFNNIKVLPDTIGNLQQLQQLYLNTNIDHSKVIKTCNINQY